MVNRNNTMSKGSKEAQNMSNIKTHLYKPTDCETGRETPKVGNCVIKDSCQQRSKGYLGQYGN